MIRLLLFRETLTILSTAAAPLCETHWFWPLMRVRALTQSATQGLSAICDSVTVDCVHPIRIQDIFGWVFLEIETLYGSRRSSLDYSALRTPYAPRLR